MKRLIYGVGVNDADYTLRPTVDGKQISCPAYTAWANMLMRAYSPTYGAKHPTYAGVTVCQEWHSFITFKRWYDEHYVEGWHLDKDLLTDSREYGPSTCVFVPGWLNTFLADRRNGRGEHPVGVYWSKHAGRLLAQCGNPISKKREGLGYFDDAGSAHRAWLDRKVELAYQLKDWMDAIDRRIYFRVVEIIFRAE